jgi:hypothetical protein
VGRFSRAACHVARKRSVRYRAVSSSGSAAGRARAHRGEHEGAVGDIRVIARVLDDARRRGIRPETGDRQREGRLLAARQRHLDRIGKFARQQRRIGGLGGRGGAPWEDGPKSGFLRYDSRGFGQVRGKQDGEEGLSRDPGADLASFEDRHVAKDKLPAE